MTLTFAHYISVFRELFVRYCRDELQKLGLSQGLLYFLLYIGRHPKCSQRELSSALHADEGHTARSVDRLVQGGFVDRKRREDSKRTFSLTLTGKGEDAFRRAHELFGEWDRELLSELSPERRELLFTILEELSGKKGGAAMSHRGVHCVYDKKET